MKPTLVGSGSFSFPTPEFRALPIPGDSPGAQAKLATCFVKAEDLPEALGEWMDVNPRIPQRDRHDQLNGRVAKAMIQTLEEEPEQFVLKNQGIWLLVDKVMFDKESGGLGSVTVTLTDKEAHGLVNGGHTFLALRQVARARTEAGQTEPWGAYVRLHIIEGAQKELVTALAEGLNRSMQVDNPSLENLKGTFEEIQKALGGKKGHDQIAYFQGATGEIEVNDVLTIMGVFNMDRYPDRKRHPNNLFGQPKAVLDAFVADDRGGKVYRRILPKLHELLCLAERLQQEAIPFAAKMKISEAKKGNRVGSAKHKGRAAVFTSGTIDGKIPHGWLLPMLAAFRANVSMSAWNGSPSRFDWLIDPEKILPNVIEEMVQVIYQEHRDNNHKPAEVGRKEAAYRLCFGIVQMELAGRGALGLAS